MRMTFNVQEERHNIKSMPSTSCLDILVFAAKSSSRAEITKPTVSNKVSVFGYCLKVRHHVSISLQSFSENKDKKQT